MDAQLKTSAGESSLVPDLCSVEVSADDFMSHLGLCMNVSSSTWAGDIHSVEEPLRADDFFSLLELQSCSKSASAANPPKTPETKLQRCRAIKYPVKSNNRPAEEEPKSIADHSPLVRTIGSESADFGSAGSFHSQVERVAESEATSDLPPTCAAVAAVIGAAVVPPMPFPSRGKWMPGLKPRDIHKSGSSVEYHCKVKIWQQISKHVLFYSPTALICRGACATSGK